MFLLINKPSGPTSHDIINQLRKITGIKRIGHAGTLDPFAQGLLICAVSRASTRCLDQFLKLDKTYLATLCLGVTSDTYDRTGNIVLSSPYQGEVSRRATAVGTEGYCVKLTKRLITATLQKFIGEQLQVPPAYSAKKINGKKAYELARQGKPVNLKPNKITIYSIKIKELKIKNASSAGIPPIAKDGVIAEQSKLKIEVHCSSGTYIRSLAHDIGQALGCGAILEKLVRMKIGPYDLHGAVSPDLLTSSTWQRHAF